MTASKLAGGDPAAESDRPAVSRQGDLWVLGRHRLICGDGRDTNAYATLLGRESVTLTPRSRRTGLFRIEESLCVEQIQWRHGKLLPFKNELVFVFKAGSAPHLNTFGLGDTGRYRTNVWDYPGVNSFRAGRMEELALHPTVKPVALVADAIKDCSRRGDLMLDPFGGSGTTLIAAQKSGRRARLIEYDPAYCDVILRRQYDQCDFPVE